MAQIKHRINLQTASYPLVTTDKGQTVVLPSKGETTPPEEAVPGIFYMQNVMPTAIGYASVGIVDGLPDTSGFGVGFFNAIGVVAVVFEGQRAYIIIPRSNFPDETTLNRLVVVNPDFGTVHSALMSSGFEDVNGIEFDNFTFAEVNSRTFMAYDSIEQWEMTAIDAFTTIAFTGLVVTEVRGLVSSNGYLIAYGDSTIAWSSTIDPTDFTPSQTTGAGGGSVADLGSNITFCKANDTGFIIYTETNAIAALYTGNRQYPFRFVPIKGAAGCIRQGYATSAQEPSTHFVYSKAGLQEVVSGGAKTVLPEVLEFFRAGLYEAVAEDLTITHNSLIPEEEFFTNISLIASRYLAISYGKDGDDFFSHAIVLDLVLNRAGKVALDHNRVFELIVPTNLAASTEFTEAANIGFLQGNDLLQNSKYYTLDWTGSVDADASDRGSSLLLLGKFQYARSRFLDLQEIKIDKEVKLTGDTSDLELQVITEFEDGSTSISTPTQILDTTKRRTYGSDVSGKNHVLAFKDRFKLTSLELVSSLGGKC